MSAARPPDLVSPGFVLRGLATNERSPAAAEFFGRFVTLSTCLAEGAPAAWVHEDWPFEPGRREAAAAEAGCDEHVLGVLQECVRRQLESGHLRWPDVFAQLDGARAFMRLLPRPRRDLMLLGLGVRADDAERYARDSVLDDLSRRLQALPPGGEWLGWEPVTASGDPLGHSWRCNGIDVEARRRLRVVPNEHGLVDDERAARRIAELCDSGELGAEPEPWFAVGVVRYPFEA